MCVLHSFYHHADCTFKRACTSYIQTPYLLCSDTRLQSTFIVVALLKPLVRLIAAALVQVGKALSEPPAAADDATQLAKASEKTPSTTAKTGDAATQPAVADVKLAKPAKKARSTAAKAIVELGPDPANDVSQLAKPSRKARSTTANSTGASMPEQTDAAATLAKPFKKTTATSASRKIAFKAAASGASSKLSDSPVDTRSDSQGSAAEHRTPAKVSKLSKASKQSEAQTEHTAVLASQAANSILSAESDRVQSGNEPDAELSPATEKRRSKREATVSRSTSKGKGQGAPAKVVLPSYQQLKAQMPADGQWLPGQWLSIAPSDREAIKVHMRAFRGSANVQDQALALYVNSQVP